MSVCTETIEFKLAYKELSRLERQGFGYYQCVQSAMRHVVSQGFGKDYAQQVAEEAWDMLCAGQGC